MYRGKFPNWSTFPFQNGLSWKHLLTPANTLQKYALRHFIANALFALFPTRTTKPVIASHFSPQTTFRKREGKTHETHTASDLSQFCLWVVTSARPSLSVRGDGAAPEHKSAGLWQVLLFPKRSPQLQHITCGNFSWILNGF